MRASASCAFSTVHVTTPWQLASRAASVVRSCAAKAESFGGHPAEEDAPTLQQPQAAPPVLLRDIFRPKGSSSRWSGKGGLGAGKRAPLHRLNRLQEVANLALENRAESGVEPWGCADIGTDHGLLAICLHANGANVIAGDRAARPLGVARENARLYLRHAREESFSAATAPATEEGAPRVRRYTGLLDAAAGSRELPLQGIGDGIGEGDFVDAANFRRLECRLGDGLAVLEPGEVDTVCIAGVGVKTMIQILGAHDDGYRTGQEYLGGEVAPALSSLGIRRLVLQPMDARLEYMRDLRVWLRENGWQITQETIVSTPGKGGNHAFLTLRADFAGEPDDLRREGWHQPDWLGIFLPARATNLRGDRRQRDRRREAATFLAYLRHQRDWLRAIERARTTSSAGGKPGIEYAATVLEGMDRVVAVVEEASRGRSGGVADQLEISGEPLVTARRWRRSAGSARGGR